MWNAAGTAKTPPPQVGTASGTTPTARVVGFALSSLAVWHVRSLGLLRESYAVLFVNSYNNTNVFGVKSQGEVYILEYKGDIYHLPCGNLCASSCLPEGSPPSYESVDCFVDRKSARVLKETAPACASQDAMSPDVSNFIVHRKLHISDIFASGRCLVTRPCSWWWG